MHTIGNHKPRKSFRKEASSPLSGSSFYWPDLLALFAAALVIRAVAILVTGFDGLYGQDPFAYYDYSIELLAELKAFRPPPPFFWPIGYPLLVTLMMFFTGIRPLAGQLVSVLAGALAAVLVYELVREFTNGSRWCAIVAGLLTSISAQLMISSLSVMSDAAGMAWITLSAWALVRYFRTIPPKQKVETGFPSSVFGVSPSVARAGMGWLVLAAFALGSAILTRWVYALAAAPWGISLLLAWRAASFRPREAAAAAGLAIAVGALVLGSQFVFELGRSSPSHVGDLQVVGWNPWNALRSTVTNADGIFQYERPIGLYYALPAIHPAFIFPSFAPFLLLGLWDLRRAQPAIIALFIGWPLLVYVFLAGIAWENPRFSLAMLPPLVTLVGSGIDLARNAWPRWRPAIAGWCVLGLLGSLAWSVGDVRAFAARTQDNLAITRWTEAQVPSGATLLTFGLTLTLDHYTSLAVVELFNETPRSLEPQVCAGDTTFLLIDPANIESQWVGKPPELNYRWLREQAGLRELGRQGDWTLFVVEGKTCA